MKNILTPEDKGYLEDLIKNLKEESKILTKKLGEYAAHGGAVPFQIPEYQATDDKLRTIKERVTEIQKVLASSEVVPFEKISSRKINCYSLVSVSDENDSKIMFYLIHPEITEKITLPPETFPVSPNSPVGKSLIGKRENQKASVKLKNSQKTYLIISFEKKYFNS